MLILTVTRSIDIEDNGYGHADTEYVTDVLGVFTTEDAAMDRVHADQCGYIRDDVFRNEYYVHSAVLDGAVSNGRMLFSDDPDVMAEVM